MKRLPTWVAGAAAIALAAAVAVTAFVMVLAMFAGMKPTP